jgi:hypothetical protein
MTNFNYGFAAFRIWCDLFSETCDAVKRLSPCAKSSSTTFSSQFMLLSRFCRFGIAKAETHNGTGGETGRCKQIKSSVEAGKIGSLAASCRIQSLENCLELNHEKLYENRAVGFVYFGSAPGCILFSQ